MAIIYCTTNKINGKKYIGSDTKDRSLEEYPGSGKLLLRAIEKYGIKNFEKIILEECEISDIKEREEYWLNLVDAASNTSYYNITNNYFGGKTPTSFKSGQDNLMYGKSPWNKNLTKDDPRVNKYVMSGQLSKQGLRWYYNKETLEVRQFKNSPSENWEIGRPNVRGLSSPMKDKHHTEKAKQKNREAHLGRKRSKETNDKMLKIHLGRKNTNETKSLMRESAIGNFLYTNQHTGERKRFKNNPGNSWVRGMGKK